MNTIEIWKLENTATRLILKGKPSPDVFWLELYRQNKLVERSETINDWNNELPGLMEKYNWKSYETMYVDSLFTKLISEFRKSYGHYKRPSSRERILIIYDRFLNSEEISLARVAYEFSVGREEIKKDIRIIRDILKLREKKIEYIRSNKVYKVVS